MLIYIYNSLLRIPFWRKHQRRLAKLLKSTFNVPNAYGDMISLAKEYNIEAILDIGSYRGETIIRFSDELTVPVYGFEPTSTTYLELSKRFLNSNQIRLFNLALSDTNSKALFYCNQNAQTNSLLDNDTGNNEVFGQYTEHLKETIVETKKLDSFVSQYIPESKLLLKVDIQGAEGKLLDGGKSTINNKVAAIYSEAQIAPMYKGQIDFSNLHRRLATEFNFELFNIYPGLRDKKGKLVQLDALWVNSEILEKTN